ncbi:MAG: RNA polymerase sigma factor [Lawsonibacter sp.]
MGTDEERRTHFAALVQEHSRSMYRSARALLSGDAQAQDAVGEAVLLAWQNFEKLRNLQAAKGWLLKITVNCAYAQMRRDKCLVGLEEAERVVAPEPEERPRELWQAVLCLPEEQRLVVTLYYYEDMAIAQIARTLGIPQGTVKSRLSRGRERLRKWLEEEDGYGMQRL